MTRSHSDAVIDISARLNAELASNGGRAQVEPRELGVHVGVSMAEYHAWSAVSNSRLSHLRRSPAHLRAYLQQPPEETLALKVGRAVHTAILEPSLFDGTFAVATQCEAIKKGDKQRCTNAGTRLSATDGWLCGVHGKSGVFDDSKIALSPADFEVCMGARNAVREHIAASELLSGSGDVELSLVWESLLKDSDENGVVCKARYDRINSEYEAIVDIKTTRDASRREFERSIFEHGYHRQGAFYLHAADVLGIPVKHFVIIAVEKEPPFAVGVYRLTPGAIEAGRDEVFSLLKVYATCEALSEWPAYPQKVEDIALPTYAWQQIEDGIRQRDERAS